MKKINTVLAASALSVVAVSSQAALIPVTFDVAGTLVGADNGTQSGSLSGTINDATGQILISGVVQTATSYTNAFVTNNVEVNFPGTGISEATACTNNGGLIDICAGNAGYSVPPLALNTPTAMNITEASIYTGGSTFTTVESNSGVVITTVYSVQAVPVPAAAWLFGSALIGLAGVGRKRGVK